MKKLILLSLLTAATVQSFAATPTAPVKPTPTSAPAPVQSAGPTKVTIPLASALNLFIQEHSASRVEWQKDLELVTDPTEVPTGKFLGRGHQIKALYAYRPVTVDELTDFGKKDLYNDPRLLAWLEWFSGKQRLVSHVGFESSLQVKSEILTPLAATPAPVTVPAELSSVEKKYKYTIPESELISNKSLHLKLEEPISQAK